MAALMLLQLADGANHTDLVLCRCKSLTSSICQNVHIFALQLSGANAYETNLWANADEAEHFAPALLAGCCTGNGMLTGELHTAAQDKDACETLCRHDGRCTAISTATWINQFGSALFS